MGSELYKAVNYLAPIDSLISSMIREYDISKANINILFKYGVINEIQYTQYLNLPKIDRQVRIGLLLKDNPTAIKILKDGIIEAKRQLFSANDIQDYEVLSIKNDAVFLINKIPNITKFDNIEFVCKNIYSSFYKLSNHEYYYLFDMARQKEHLDIKGISDTKLQLHEKYFLEFILTIFCSAQTEPIEDVLNILKIFYTQYINRELDIEYYRRFDGESCFDMIPVSRYTSFKAHKLSQDNINDIDISYNLNILTQLVKIYSGSYFQNKRKMTF